MGRSNCGRHSMSSDATLPGWKLIISLGFSALVQMGLQTPYIALEMALPLCTEHCLSPAAPLKLCVEAQWSIVDYSGSWGRGGRRQGLRFASSTVVSLYIGVQQHWENAKGWGEREGSCTTVNCCCVFQQDKLISLCPNKHQIGKNTFRRLKPWYYIHFWDRIMPAGHVNWI